MYSYSYTYSLMWLVPGPTVFRSSNMSSSLSCVDGEGSLTAGYWSPVRERELQNDPISHMLFPLQHHANSARLSHSVLKFPCRLVAVCAWPLIACRSFRSIGLPADPVLGQGFQIISRSFPLSQSLSPSCHLGLHLLRRPWGFQLRTISLSSICALFTATSYS
jgi:hypothetical protein